MNKQKTSKANVFFLTIVFRHLLQISHFILWLSQRLLTFSVRAWTNEKCLAIKHHQTLLGEQTFYRLDTLFGAVWSCLIVLNRVWSCLIKFEGHQTFDQNLKTFLLSVSCFRMGDVLFVWTAASQTCLKRPCVPRLLSGLNQLFHLCLIKHVTVLTVWPLTSTLACLVTK